MESFDYLRMLFRLFVKWFISQIGNCTFELITDKVVFSFKGFNVYDVIWQFVKSFNSTKDLLFAIEKMNYFNIRWLFSSIYKLFSLFVEQNKFEKIDCYFCSSEISDSKEFVPELSDALGTKGICNPFNYNS